MNLDAPRSERAARRRKERRMEPVQHGMLFGLDSIALFFRVSRRKVKAWIEDGAPVIRQADGGRCDADSLDLYLWLLEQKK